MTFFIGVLTLAFNIQPIKVEPRALIQNNNPTVGDVIDTTGHTVQLVLETDKHVYVLGENVTIILQNIGNKRVEIGGYPAWQIFTYPEEEPVYPMIFAFLAWDLDPGENDTFTWNQYNQFNESFCGPGTYIVRDTQGWNLSTYFKIIVAEIIVPDDYPTIQDAINHANEGNTIYVRAGIYYEKQATINKPLSILGENKNTTVIDGNGTWVCVYVQSTHNISISGFTIRNGFGIYSYNSQNVAISGNIISNNGQGIILIGSTNNTISQNLITLNSLSILLSDGSSDNKLCENMITLNSGDGVWLDNSYRNIICENEVSKNGLGTAPGYHVYGIRLSYSNNNTIYHNNITGNYEQADGWMSTNNVWDNGYHSGGNYWSDYTGTDLCSGPYQNETGSDGIGDMSYVIDENNIDRYPLMNPWGVVAGNLQILKPTNESVILGSVKITFAIENWGRDVKFLKGNASNRVDLEIEYRSTCGKNCGWGIMLWSTSSDGLMLRSRDKYIQTVLYDPSEYEEVVPSDFIGDAPYGQATIRLVHWKRMNEGYAYGEFGVTEINVIFLPADTEPPMITILAPQNTTYTTSIPLTFAVNETASWIGYSLGEQANVTIAGNTTLTGLSVGAHSITIYANDTSGNMGASGTVHFMVVLKTLLGTGWGWMRIGANETVYGRAKLYKIGDERIELIITSEGETHSRKWSIISHKEYEYGERYLCYSKEWGFLIVGLHKHRRWQFWYAVGKGITAFGFPKYGRLTLMPI